MHRHPSRQFPQQIRDGILKAAGCPQKRQKLTMKRFVFTAWMTVTASIALGGSAVAAEKVNLPKSCKGVRVGMDKFTKLPTVSEDKSVMAFMPMEPWNWGWTVTSLPEGPEIVLKSAMGGGVSVKLETGWSLDALLEDGEVVPLALRAPYISQVQGGSGISTVFQPPLAASPEGLKALRKSPITAYRANFGSGLLDFKLAGSGEQLRKSIACADSLHKAAARKQKEEEQADGGDKDAGDGGEE